MAPIVLIALSMLSRVAIYMKEVSGPISFFFFCRAWEKYSETVTPLMTTDR
jgi:hypothetical protein